MREERTTLPTARVFIADLRRWTLRVLQRGAGGRQLSDVVIHAAAETRWTPANRTPTPPTRERWAAPAWRAPRHGHGARVIAVSTDYVFDGCLDARIRIRRACARTITGPASRGEEAVRRHCPTYDRASPGSTAKEAQLAAHDLALGRQAGARSRSSMTCSATHLNRRVPSDRAAAGNPFPAWCTALRG
jgi:hypothetical protein